LKEIPVALPFMGEEEIEATRQAILSGWVTQGPRVKQFEDEFARYTGAAHACAVSNCTAGLHLALLAVGTCPGDVVITVSHSYIATANAVRHCSAEPVFVDIDRDTLNMDPAALARILEEDFQRRDDGLWYRHAEQLRIGESPLCGREAPYGRLAAILVVHQVGAAADLAEILALAKRFGIPVVEDAACAIGSEISMDQGTTWALIGRPHGDIACFSFHPRKVLTTGDGGMLTTNNPEYDRKFRLLRQHGMSMSDLARHGASDIVFEDYPISGYNYRMTDVQAAIGVEQLRRLPDFLVQRRLLGAQYSEALAHLSHVRPPVIAAYARTNWQSYVARLDSTLDQKHVMRTLKAKGIHTRRGVMCAHLEAPYAKAWPAGCLPASETAQREGIILPVYHTMTPEDVVRVVDALASL
jgi:dTDP-4-amino-4,6-dideoxygalactose transaminase